MTKRSDRLLNEIEAGALDHRTPIGDLLRKVIALGGRAGSAELRDWAMRELQGYGRDDELPEYRRLAAPLQVDMINMRYHMTGQSISMLDIPEFARDTVNNDFDVRMGIAEIEQLARRCPPGEAVKLQPPFAQELVTVLNSQGNVNGHMERMYWSVSPVALEGVVEQVRTALTVLVAEIHANAPDGPDVPSAEVATNAIEFAVSGKRNKVTFAAPQGGSTVATTPGGEQRHWIRIAAAIIVGLLTIAGVVFTLMQAQGWSF